MKIAVQMFAVARQLAQRDQVELELPAGATVGDLRQALAAEVPELTSWLPNIKFAVDAEYADDQRMLTAQQEIACIPPVSGG
jgi:molybdopterin converting factor subunit 1